MFPHFDQMSQRSQVSRGSLCNVKSKSTVTGSWRLSVGSWRLSVGSWRLYVGSWRSSAVPGGYLVLAVVDS